jgi:hypothetical protein
VLFLLLPFSVYVGHAMAQLVNALRYNPEGRGFDSWWSHWSRFSLLQKWVPGIITGDKSGRCVGLTSLPPACAVCLEIWEPHPPGTLGDCSGLHMVSFWSVNKYMKLYSHRVFNGRWVGRIFVGHWRHGCLNFQYARKEEKREPIIHCLVGSNSENISAPLSPIV